MPTTAFSLFCDAAVALRFVVSMACSQSNGSCIFLILFQLVDFSDDCVCLGPGVALVDTLPFLFACILGLGRCPGACALVDRRNSVDATVCIGQVANLGIRAKVPAAHHLVVKLGPHLGSAFDGVLPGKAKRAFGPATPAGFLLHIEEHEMRVGISCVIAVLVVDGRDIPSNALAQSLRKCPRHRLSLRRCSLHRQSNHEALTDAPLALLSLFFGKGGSLGAGVARKPFLHDHTRGLGPGDVAKMGRCLARLCCAGFNRALL
nr:hypothetical protein [Phaeobacter italicus]